MCRLICLVSLLSTKRCKILTVLSLAVCFDSFAYAQNVVNLVNNWDFEDGVVNPWRLIFRAGSGGVGAFLIDEDEFLTGQASLKIEISEGGTHKRALHVIQQPLMEAVENGRDYTYSAWIKAEEERTLFMILIRSGGGAVVTPNNQEITVGPEWGEYWFTVTATASEQIRVEFEIGLSDVDIWIDHVRFYEGDYVEEALGQPPELAWDPSPADEAADVVREVVLAWNAAETTVKRHVYLGTNWDDVNDANPANPLDVLVGQNLTDTSLDVGTLAFGQIYYWRVDEVNGAPDHTVFPGDVWSFTVEPIGYPITSITATASGSFGASVPENTINGSGLVDDLHGTIATDMWISGGIPATIEYAFDRVYKLHELWVWNSNQTIESFIGFGAKDIVLEHSLDGENWTVLEGVGPLAQGPGTGGYAHNNTIGFGGAVAQHVRMTINSVQGFAPQASLSEVRFFAIPTLATGPSPDSGATDVAPDLTLSWGRNGREADSHDVYMGTDANDLSLAGRVSESGFDTLASDLQLGQTYYWQVVEVNDAMDPSEWAGAIWSFTTQESIVVDAMESYKDEEFFEIWATWIDGFEGPANNGALVGANPSLGDFAPETAIVRNGRQSLPIHYDNSAAAQSEATRTFETAQDWTAHGVKSLVLYFHGSATNTGGTLYCKINDTKVAYDSEAANLMRGGWNKWVILLGDLAGVDLSNIRSLTLGVEGGGGGVVYIDDITLAPAGERELITPTQPVGGLVLHLPFDGDYQDASGNGLHGTPMGAASPPFEAGPMGQAINFDGVDQYVEITGYKGILGPNPFSISAWIKTSGNGTMVGWGSTAGGVTRVEFRVDQNRLRCESSGNVQGNTTLPDDEWIHVAVTIKENAVIDDPDATLYLNGLADNRQSTGSPNPLDMAAGFDVTIGRRHSSGARWFLGSIDDVRIYDRTLSAGDVAGLAGRTQPFDRP